jgi:ankyrin repeat protein
MKTIEELKNILLLSDFFELKKSLDEYDVCEYDKFGNNILHYYLLHIKDISLNFKDVINELLNRGININAKQSTGQYKRSCLQITVVLNIREGFDFLIGKGADVNSTDANGNSILSNAVFNYLKDRINYGYYIKVLLDNGANPFQKNNYGISAYSLVSNLTPDNDVNKYFENIKGK